MTLTKPVVKGSVRKPVHAPTPVLKQPVVKGSVRKPVQS